MISTTYHREETYKFYLSAARPILEVSNETLAGKITFNIAPAHFMKQYKNEIKILRKQFGDE